MTDTALILGFATTLSLLVIGIKTESIVAHSLSFLTGVMLVAAAMADHFQFSIILSLSLLTTYPVIQIVAMSDGYERWKRRKTRKHK